MTISHTCGCMTRSRGRKNPRRSGRKVGVATGRSCGTPTSVTSAGSRSASAPGSGPSSSTCRWMSHAPTAACSTWTRRSTPDTARTSRRPFRHGASARSRASVRSTVRAILDDVSENGSCDFARDVADPLPTAITCDLLGIPAADRQQVAALSRSAVPLGDPEFGGRADSFRAVAELMDYGRQLRAERLRKPKRRSDDPCWRRMEIEGQRLGERRCRNLLRAPRDGRDRDHRCGRDAHGLIAFARSSRSLAARTSAFAAPRSAAVEEILRWSTPVVHFRSTALEDTRIADVEIAAGDKVVVFFNSANRDESVFADPHPGSILVACRRTPTSRSEVGGHTSASARISPDSRSTSSSTSSSRRLPDIRLSGEPTYMHSMFFNGVKALPCEFTPWPR